MDAGAQVKIRHSGPSAAINPLTRSTGTDSTYCPKKPRHFLAAGYELTAVQPFDLFPQTRHLECVVTLRRRAG